MGIGHALTEARSDHGGLGRSHEGLFPSPRGSTAKNTACSSDVDFFVASSSAVASVCVASVCFACCIQKQVSFDTNLTRRERKLPAAEICSLILNRFYDLD